MIKPADIIIFIFFSIISIGSIFFIFNTQETGDNVIVSVDSKIFKTISLSDDGVHELSDGEFHNTLKISDGKVKMISANCPDQLCVKTMAASLSGQTIVCLPNKLIVEIEKVFDDNELDAIVN